MKSIFRYVLGFLISGSILALILYLTSEHVAPVYPAEKNQTRKLLKRAKNIEVISVGNSHSRALDYQAMGLQGFYLWRNASDQFEVCHLLNAVIPLLPNLKVVFINITPVTFAQDNSMGNAAIRERSYATVPTIRSLRLMHGDFKNLVRGKLSPIIRQDHWMGVAKGLIRKCFPRESTPEERELLALEKVDESGFIGTRFEKVMNPPDPASTQRHAEWFENRYNPAIQEESFQALAATVRLLRQKQIRVILYTPPYPDVTNQYFSRKISEGVRPIRQYMERLQKEYGVEYYDFSTDELFSHRYEYFFDESHLNVKGAAIFSKKLAGHIFS